MATLNAFESQPNSDKRNEFLIVLDYLFHHTNEKHATSQAEIVKYAKSEYNVEMRRDRIPHILLHLSQLVEKYPDKFPFKLKTVLPKSASDEEKAARRKYYVSERAFSDSEILKIASAIQSDKTISNTATTKLIDKFFQETASEDKIASLKKKLEKKQRKTSKFTDRGMDYLEKVEEMAVNNERVWFTIKDYGEVDFDRPRFTMVRNMKDIEEHVGYIYAVKEVNNKFVLIIYLSDYKHAMITPTTNIVITRHMDLNDISEPIDFTLDNSKYASIDEWVEKHYKGQDGVPVPFTFKFTLENLKPTELEYIEHAYRNHWKMAMEYTTKERDAEVYITNEKGEQVVIDTKKVHDAYVTIKTTRESFVHWYRDFKIWTNVVVVSPSFFNDHFFGRIVNLLTRRLSKYGSRYDYEISRKPKPDYLKFLQSMNMLEDEKPQEILENTEGVKK